MVSLLLSQPPQPPMVTLMLDFVECRLPFDISAMAMMFCVCARRMRVDAAALPADDAAPADTAPAKATSVAEPFVAATPDAPAPDAPSGEDADVEGDDPANPRRGWWQRTFGA